MLSRVGILYLLHDVILNISHGIRHHMLVPLFKSTTRPTLRHVSALISTGALGQSVFQLNFSLCVIQWPTRNLYKAQCQPSHVFFSPTRESVDFKSAVPWGIPRPNEFRLMVMATKSIPMIDKSRLGALQIPANLTYKYPNF